jgi:general stress protein YciG
MDTTHDDAQPASEASGRRRTRRASKRGFAALSPDRLREIARKGGKAAHLAGTAHEFTPEEARVAGRKGGIASHRNDEARLRGGARDETQRQEESADASATTAPSDARA